MTAEQSVPSLTAIRGRTNMLKTKQSNKTRENIRVATGQLAASHKTVNVTTVAEAAGISRGTFYTHYADIEELGVEVLRLDLTSRQFSIDELVKHYVQNRHFYRHVLEETTSRQVLENVVSFIVEELLAVSAVQRGDGNSLEKEAIFTAWGYIGTLDWWLRQDQSLTPGELGDFLRSRTPSFFLP